MRNRYKRLETERHRERALNDEAITDEEYLTIII